MKLKIITMRKLLLFTITLATSYLMYAQSSSKVQILPAPSSGILSVEKGNFNPNVPKAITCNDTLRYPQLKEQIVGNGSFAIFELWTADAEEMSQAFLISGASHQITGVELFGRDRPGGATSVTVRASIFAVDGNNNPIGTELAFGTLTISDTNYIYRQINLTQPVTVSSNYAVVIKPTSANGIVQFYINNPAPNQTYDENLSRVKSAYYTTSNNNWVSVPTLTTNYASEFPQGPHNFEMLVAPRVSYAINTNFTTTPSPACAGTPVTFNNGTTPASLISNRMYNFTAMQMHFLNEPDSLYATDPGVTPATFLWGTTVNYTYSAANTYNATRYTLGGLWASCLDFQANPVVVNSAPTQPLGISGPNPICANSSGNYAINPVTGATSYTWTLPSGWTGTSTSNVIPVTVGTNSGTVSVTANNACGSSTPATLSVTVNQDNATFTYPSNTICAGGPNSLPTIVTPGGIFNSTPAGLVFTNPSTGEINVAASAVGTYSVTYTTAGACPNTQTQTITITTAPDASFTYANSAYCVNGTNPAPNITGSAGIFTASPSGLSISASTGVINLAASTPGTYTVTNTIAASGSCPLTTATATVTINPLPTATITGGGNICTGNNATVSIALTGTGPWNFTYSDGSNTTPVSGQTSSPFTFNVNTAGTYTVTTVSDANCSGTVSGSATVTVNPLPTATVTGGGNICAGNNATVSIALTGTGPWNFTYSDGTNTTPVTGQTTSPYTFNTSTAGTYTVTAVSDANCVGSGSGSATVTVNALPTVTFTLSNTNVCTSAAPIALSGGSPAGGTYSGTGVSGGQFNPATAGVGTHTITYTFTDGNGCSASATQNITVSVCSGMEESSIAKSLLIAPNPAREQLMISFNNANSNNVQVNIISADGKLLYSENAAAASQYVKYVDVTSFAKGLYFIQIVSEEGMINNKIIVQ
jgi:hypothetical protein